jgi:DNA-binding beta-propeller fold protein YncE
MRVLLILTLVGTSAAALAGTPAGTRSIPLPGAPAEGVVMDYIAYDKAQGVVWVPAGNTGRVDVLDIRTDAVTAIEGFATKEVERNGRKRTIGPSSVAVADGVVFVGNRGDDSICAIDAVTRVKGACVILASMPDAIAWVRSTKEVWVTTQANNSIVVLDASRKNALRVKTTFALAGAPESLAVDELHNVVYTNLEDKDKTLAVDVKSRKVRSTWDSGCGEEGPRGVAFDARRAFVFVACTTSVRVLDAGHRGQRLASMDVGDGVDSIDYVAARHELFAAARSGRLVIAAVAPNGDLSTLASVDTPAGSRNAVATEDGVAFLTSAREGAIVVVTRE